MKCLNMKIADILFFLANFITIYSSDFRQDKTSQTTTLKVEEISNSKLDTRCPHLLEIVRESKYEINCKGLTSDVINEDTVLETTCFIIRDILSFICDKKLNLTSNSLKRDNSNFCPFIFSDLEQLGVKFSPNKELVKELTIKDHCSEVCTDLYGPRVQCVLLDNLQNFLRNVSQSSTQKDLISLDKPQVNPEQTVITNQKTESTEGNTKNEEQPEKSDLVMKAKTGTIIKKPSEGGVNVTKAMKAENKTEKAVTVSSVPNKEPIESEPKKEPIESEPNNFGPEINEEEMMNTENNLEVIGDEPDGPKPDVVAVPSTPRQRTFEDEKLTSIQQKNDYSRDLFFQAEDSHFFFYFIMVSSVIVIGYLAFHNKNKILAYALEGTSGRRSRRRPNPARYRKLETNLEEVISSSSTNVAASSVVY